jgi:hypothetical protein
MGFSEHQGQELLQGKARRARGLENSRGREAPKPETQRKASGGKNLSSGKCPRRQ